MPSRGKKPLDTGKPHTSSNPASYSGESSELRFCGGSGSVAAVAVIMAMAMTFEKASRERALLVTGPSIV
jgi:hypothetical protein